MTKFPQDFWITGKIICVAFVLFTIFLIFTALHEHIWKSDIIFYGYIKILIIFNISAVAVVFALRKFSCSLKKTFNFSTVVLSSIISCLLYHSFNMTFPIVMDRSFSVYMLGALYKLDSPVHLSEFDSIVSKYFHERSLVDKRIYEQLATGSIKICNDKIELTERGRSIVEIHVLIGRVFNLDMNNIAP